MGNDNALLDFVKAPLKHRCNAALRRISGTLVQYWFDVLIIRVISTRSRREKMEASYHSFPAPEQVTRQHLHQLLVQSIGTSGYSLHDVLYIDTCLTTHIG